MVCSLAWSWRLHPGGTGPNHHSWEPSCCSWVSWEADANIVLIVVHSLDHVWLFVTPWTAARQASLSFTISQSLLRFMFIELVMQSNHLILWDGMFITGCLWDQQLWNWWRRNQDGAEGEAEQVEWLTKTPGHLPRSPGARMAFQNCPELRWGLVSRCLRAPLGGGATLSKAMSSAKTVSKEDQEMRPSSASMFSSCFGDGWMDRCLLCSPFYSWYPAVTEFVFLGSKITVDGDCSHETKRRLLLGKKAITNLDSILKSKDITLLMQVRIVKAIVFSVVMYGCESWAIKKTELPRTEAFELWC